MEIKKSPKADLQNKRSLFLEIGLVVSIGLMILAFGYGQTEKVVMDVARDDGPVLEDLVEITVQDKEPPKPVKQTITVISDIINVVKNETKITTDFDFAEFGDEDINIQAATVEEEVIQEEEIFFVAEDMPTFQGGDLNTFRNWVNEKLRYPPVASENGIQGTVTVKFVIERDGSLTNIEVLRSPDNSLSEETIRVLKTSPKWQPGRQRGNPVRVAFNLPVQFRLQQ